MTQRILIVDDDDSARMSVELALTMAGYKVQGAESAGEAIEHIAATFGKAEQFDLLITDLQMPGMSGLQLIDALNEMEIEIPKIVLTGYAEPRVIRRLGEKGCHNLYEKPLDPKTLINQVERVLTTNMDRTSGWGKNLLPPNPFRLTKVENVFNTILASDG